MKQSEQSLSGDLDNRVVVVSKNDLRKNESWQSQQTRLPPVIVLNPREIIVPEKIHIETIFKNPEHETKEKDLPAWREYALKWIPQSRPVSPTPIYPIKISWRPDVLNFALDKEPVTHILRVRNSSSRSMCAHFCGLWADGDAGRVGASWHCHPKTRFFLAPGIAKKIYIKASPRETSPVSKTYCGLQLAGGNLRDNVVGFFMVPLKICFLNYKPAEY